MNEKHVKVFTGSPLLVRRLKSILEENQISSLSKSDTIVAYEISNNIDELYVLNLDLDKSKEIVEAYKKEINA
jgi:hypothetical protein